MLCSAHHWTKFDGSQFCSPLSLALFWKALIYPYFHSTIKEHSSTLRYIIHFHINPPFMMLGVPLYFFIISVRYEIATALKNWYEAYVCIYGSNCVYLMYKRVLTIMYMCRICKDIFPRVWWPSPIRFLVACQFLLEDV